MQQSKHEDLLSLYFRYVEQTEAPLQFHRWSLVAGVGAILGRQFYIPFGTSRIYPNCYVMLVGNPGTRKSSAIKTAKKVLSAAGYTQFSAEKTSKEKFLLDLEGLPENEYSHEQQPRRRRSNIVSSDDVLASLDLGTSTAGTDAVPRECFVCADEFNEFTGAGNIDFFSLLGALWDWDDENSPYRYRLKNSKSLTIYQPTISILGGNTHTGIQTGFPPESVGQGFMSRLLFIYGEPSGKRITFPEPPPKSLGDAISRFIGEIKSKVSGEAELDKQARSALDAIYRSWKEIDDYRFKHYSTRRFTHLLKLVMICAAMRLSKKLELQDVLLANSMLTFAEHNMPKALGEFGKSRNSEVAQTIMAHLYSANAPVPAEALWKIVSRDLDKKEQLMDILTGLRTANKLTYADKAGGFLPVQKPVSSKALYVDLRLIKESGLE